MSRDKRRNISDSSNWYISREAAKRYIGIESSIKNTRIDSLIEQTSRFVDKYCDRFFHPKLETRYFDYQDATELLLDCDLLSITTFLKDIRQNSGTEVASGNIILFPLNETPYHKIMINPVQDFLVYSDFPEKSISIEGVFGYTEESENTGAALTSSINANDTTMQINDGSLIEVGYTLLIDSEQIFVVDVDVIDSTADTAEAVDTYETAIDVNNGSLLNANEVMRIDSEDMLIVSIASNTLTVVRGYNGTKADSHDTATTVNVFREFTIEGALNGTTAAAHTTNDTIYRYVPPQPVTQAVGILVARADKRSDSAWADTIGSTEMGTPLYFKSIPDDVRDLLAAYRKIEIGVV